MYVFRLAYRGIVWLVSLCASVFNEFLWKNGPYMAAAVSFYSLLCLFPLILGLISIFGFFLGIGGFEERLVAGLHQQIPVIEDRLISGALRAVAERRIANSVLASVLLLWAGTSVFGAIRKSTNYIWGITRTRPFLQERAMDIGLMFGAAVLLFLSVLTTGFFSFVQQIFEVLMPETVLSGDELWRRLGPLVPPLATYATFLLLYVWLPNTRVRFSEAWLPAVGAALAFEITKIVFVLFLQRFGQVTASIYGVVAGVIALTVFIFVTAIIFLVGALLTSRYATYLSVRDQRRRVERLSRDLERIRSTPGLPGLPA
ncbi:MAG: YihY/virulence factor BrkB family protein [Gemmatimonadetes bacterium]|nr:YihY/virulence factor BrkB family protein [Gemmatimonadota bacterium]